MGLNGSLVDQNHLSFSSFDSMGISVKCVFFNHRRSDDRSYIYTVYIYIYIPAYYTALSEHMKGNVSFTYLILVP